jgi:hypothetical protein
MEQVCIFYGHLVYLMAIWCICWLIGIFFSVLVSITEKNLATLVEQRIAISARTGVGVIAVSEKTIRR